MLFATADSVLLLLASRVVQGLGGGTIGVVQACGRRQPAGEAHESLGWLSAVTSPGRSLGRPSARRGGVGGQSLPGWAAAGFALLVALFGWFFLRESRLEMTTTTEHPIPGREALVGVVTRWREPAPRLIWTYSIGIGSFYGIIPLVPLLLHSRLGVTEDTIGYFIMYLGGWCAMRTFALGPLVDRLGEPRSRAGE
jgi:hypothetical protein